MLSASSRDSQSDVRKVQPSEVKAFLAEIIEPWDQQRFRSRDPCLSLSRRQNAPNAPQTSLKRLLNLNACSHLLAIPVLVPLCTPSHAKAKRVCGEPVKARQRLVAECRFNEACVTSRRCHTMASICVRVSLRPSRSSYVLLAATENQAERIFLHDRARTSCFICECSRDHARSRSFAAFHYAKEDRDHCRSSRPRPA